MRGYRQCQRRQSMADSTGRCIIVPRGGMRVDRSFPAVTRGQVIGLCRCSDDGDCVAATSFFPNVRTTVQKRVFCQIDINPTAMYVQTRLHAKIKFNIVDGCARKTSKPSLPFWALPPPGSWCRNSRPLVVVRRASAQQLVTPPLL